MTPGDAVLVLIDPTPGARVWAWGRVVKANRKTATIDLQLEAGGVERARVPHDKVTETVELNLGPQVAPQRRGMGR